MRITRELRRMIAEGQPTRTLRQKAIEEGFIELRKSALLKVARGETFAEGHPHHPVGVPRHRGVMRPDGPTGARALIRPGGHLLIWGEEF